MKWIVMFLLFVLVVILHGEPMISASSDYEYYPGFGLYKLVPERTSWYDAFENCRRDGAHLLIINSRKEANLVIDISSKLSYYDNFIWVGVTDFYSKGHFYDIKGNSLEDTGYVNWGESPQNYTNCAHIYKVNAYMYANGFCSDKLSYICEIGISV